MDGDRRDQEIADFLATYPSAIASRTDQLRVLVRAAAPHAVERLRTGWRLIGYDLPVGPRSTYFAWIMPEPAHVHIGWQTGTLMSDPDRRLRGAHLKLKKVRYLTFAAKDRIPRRVVVDFTRDAARIASLSRGERELLAAIRAQSIADG